MSRSIVVLLALVAVSCAQDEAVQPRGAKDVGHHEAGAAHEAKHIVFTPDAVPWKDGPASLPKGAQVAVLEGDPTKSGYFSMRLKFPDGYVVPPHWHPGTERVTVIAGTLNLGNGERFDKAATKALVAGSYSSMTPGMRHFAWAGGETVLQLSTIGPLEINYVNPADDPRKK